MQDERKNYEERHFNAKNTTMETECTHLFLLLQRCKQQFFANPKNKAYTERGKMKQRLDKKRNIRMRHQPA
jgi:hypothetical protein